MTCVFGSRFCSLAMQLSMVVGDAIAGLIQDHQGMIRGHSIHIIRFLSRSFLVRWHVVLRRGHSKALRRSLGYLFLLLHFVVLSLLLCVNDWWRGDGLSSYSSLGYEIHAVHIRVTHRVSCVG
jgi:hypothetical protein